LPCATALDVAGTGAVRRGRSERHDIAGFELPGDASGNVAANMRLKAFVILVIFLTRTRDLALCKAVVKSGVRRQDTAERPWHQRQRA